MTNNSRYDSDNIFARILRGEIPCREVFSDETVLAFHDIAPAAAVHVLVVPRGEYVSFDDFCARAEPQQVADFFARVQRIAAQLGLSEMGYRLITNHGRDATQTVPHFHVHILGGQMLGPLLASHD